MLSKDLPSNVAQIDLNEIASSAEPLTLIAQAVETTVNGLVISSALEPGFPIVYVSEAFCEFTGYSREEILGHHCDFLQGVDTDPNTIQAIREALQNHITFRGEVLNYRKNGEPFWNLLRIEPLFNGDRLEYFVGVQTDISAQKHAQERLQQYESIFNSTSDLMSLIHKDFTYLAVNDAYVKSFGKSKKDIIGHPIHELQGDIMFNLKKPNLARAFAGETVHTQYWVTPKGKAPRYIDVNITPYEGSAGDIQGAVISTRDITGLKKVEQELEHAEAIFAQSSDRISIIGTDYRYRFTNACNLEFYQKEAHEVIGQLTPDIIGRDRFEDHTKGYLDRCFKGERVNYQKWAKNDQVYVDILMEPYREKDGKISGAIVTLRDITHRRRAQEALERSETRFRDFAEIAADFFWETDANLRFSYLSEQQEHITNYPASYWLEHSYFDYLELTVEDESMRALQRQSLLNKLSLDEELPLKRPDGSVRMVRMVAKPIFDSQGVFKGYRGIGHDITEAYHLTQQLEYQATYDELTGLMNRHAFDQQLGEALDRAKLQAQHHVLCYIDLDQFKIVNDTVGHAAGDELLRQVSALLKSNIRTSDVLARLGGDEFALLLEKCPLNKGIIIAEKIVADLRDYSFCWQERRFKVGASIGVVAIDPTTESAVQLMSQADVACYAAKDEGRNRVHVYHTDNSSLSEQHAELMRVSDIRSALQHNRFCLYYQYITPLDETSGLAPYYELLLRLKDERGKLVSPGTFIPAAERYNLMQDIDRWVIRTALVEQQDLFAQLSSGYIAINLSGTSLNDSSLLGFVKAQFAESRLPPERICFEITETAVISNLSEALAFIKVMRELGCKFALDDFGSGLSSFAYLKRFDVDFLKIDGNLVRDMTVDYTDQVMVSAINEIGHAMNILTIAEFVETEADIALLASLQVDYAQGYAISRPKPLETLITCTANHPEQRSDTDLAGQAQLA